jgi:hypothetical protein
MYQQTVDEGVELLLRGVLPALLPHVLGAGGIIDAVASAVGLHHHDIEENRGEYAFKAVEAV